MRFQTAPTFLFAKMPDCPCRQVFSLVRIQKSAFFTSVCVISSVGASLRYKGELRHLSLKEDVGRSEDQVAEVFIFKLDLVVENG